MEQMVAYRNAQRELEIQAAKKLEHEAAASEAVKQSGLAVVKKKAS